MTTSTADRHFTVAEIAERYRVNQTKVLGWIAAGELKAVNVASNPNGHKPRWRIDPDAVLDFERCRSAVPSSPAVRRRRKRLPTGYVERY